MIFGLHHNGSYDVSTRVRPDEENGMNKRERFGAIMLVISSIMCLLALWARVATR